MKPSLNVVCCGDEATGKSCLGGTFALNSGSLPPRIINNLKSSYQRFSNAPEFDRRWILDRTRLERELGKSVDGNVVAIEISHFLVSWFDTPGYPPYMHKVVGFMAQSDAAVLVVEPRLETQQNYLNRTWSLASYLYMFQVRQVVVVINKMDTIDFSEALFEKRKEQILKLLKVIGFQEKNIFGVIPVVGLRGINITKVKPDTVMEKMLKQLAWYRGDTLEEVINKFQKTQRVTKCPPVIIINKVMRVSGVGTVITGGIIRGTLQKHDKLLIVPGGIETSADNIEIYHTMRKIATAGDQVGVKVTITLRRFGRSYRGFMVGRNRGKEDLPFLFSPPAQQNNFINRISRSLILKSEFRKYYSVPEAHKSFIADILIVRPNLGKNEIPFSEGISVHVQSRLIHCHAKVLAILAKLDKKTFMPITRSQKVSKGDLLRVQFFCIEPHFVSPQDTFPELSRIVISDAISIVGAGIVKSALDYRFPIRIATNVERIEEMVGPMREILERVDVKVIERVDDFRLDGVNLLVLEQGQKKSSGGLVNDIPIDEKCLRRFVHHGGTCLFLIQPSIGGISPLLKAFDLTLLGEKKQLDSRKKKIGPKYIKFKSFYSKNEPTAMREMVSLIPRHPIAPKLKLKPDEICFLHKDILFCIFQHVDAISLVCCSMVNKTWHLHASQDYFWLAFFEKQQILPSYSLPLPSDDPNTSLITSGFFIKWRYLQFLKSSSRRGGRVINGPHGKVQFHGSITVQLQATPPRKLHVFPSALYHIPRFLGHSKGQVFIQMGGNVTFKKTIFLQNLAQDSVLFSYQPTYFPY